MSYKKVDKVPSAELMANAFYMAKKTAEARAIKEYQAKKKQQAQDEPDAKKK